MKAMRGNSGFSLVELLTVIAIIAILAGIIFPVMNAVKNNAKKTQCMTNMYNVAQALKMFKQDNGYYPASLAGEVQYDPSTSAVIPLDRTTGNGTGLFPDYTKGGSGYKTFHCPLSPTSKTDAVTTADGKSYYAYDSYTVYTSLPVNPGTPLAGDKHYRTDWAPTLADVAGGTPGLKPYPPGTTDGAELQTYDYKRQLKFRYPPDDTLVTWCSYHERVGDARSMVPVLFLTGTAEMMPASELNACKWRIHPKS
jgi:prepilin-type N-terminal cleavage/methylation domain-containing protein